MVTVKCSRGFWENLQSVGLIPLRGASILLIQVYVNIWVSMYLFLYFYRIVVSRQLKGLFHVIFFSQFHQTELHLLSCLHQCLSQSINKCIFDGLPINTPDVMCIAFHKSRHKYSLDIPFACLRMEMQPGGVSVRSETELLHPNVPVCFFWQD